MEVLTPITEKKEKFKLAQVVTYNQISSRLWLQLLDNDYNGINYPFFCKDYIQDIYFVERCNIDKFEQYKFYWDKDKFKVLSSPTAKLALSFSGYADHTLIATEESLVWSKRLINEVEEVLGFEPSKFELFKDENIVVVEYDNLWSEIPYLLSLFTGITRQLIGLTSEPIDLLDFLTNTTRYHKTIYQSETLPNDKYCVVVKHILEGKELPIQHWEDYNKGSNYMNNSHSDYVHNNTGILANYDNLFNNVIKEVDDSN